MAFVPAPGILRRLSTETRLDHTPVYGRGGEQTSVFNGYLQGEVVKRPGLDTQRGQKVGLMGIQSTGWVQGLCVAPSDGRCLRRVPGGQTVLGTRRSRAGCLCLGWRLLAVSLLCSQGC